MYRMLLTGCISVEQRAFEKIEALETRQVRKNEIDINFLYQTLSAIDNLS